MAWCWVVGGARSIAAPWAPHSKEWVRSLNGRGTANGYGWQALFQSGAVGAALQRVEPFAEWCGTANGFG
jgi:hypothetical protein